MTAPKTHLLHPKYRPDIDGLRAIAVLAVVAFHAFPSTIRGGFIGVDVFFVISGFLISTILFENLEKGSFSFSEFYVRRIRRIFPALILILVFCFSVGWLVLLADEYKQLGIQIAAGAGFVSNLVLWSEAGYFDNAADTKPLLHLWSLGIEEQFYIIWPFLLWLAWKRKFNLFVVTTIVAIISFFLNAIGVEQNIIATFYSPQTRFWELLSGSMLAWIVLYKKYSITSYTLLSTLSCLGLLLLALGFWEINKELNFPGLWALIPVTGTLLLLSAGPLTPINHKVLSNKILVWFGLISFPLYLWHWPLLSFARIIKGEEPSSTMRLALVALSILLAWLTYKFIERPLRFGAYSKTKEITLILAMLAVGYAGFNAYERDGFLFRLIAKNNLTNAKMLKWSSEKTAGCESKLGSPAPFCLELGNTSNQTIAVIGDSTANSIAPGLFNIFNANKNEGLINIGSSTCPPIRGLTPEKNWGGPNSPSAPNCVAIVERTYQYILKNPNIKTVVLVFVASDIQSWGIPNLPHADLIGRINAIKPLINRNISELQKAGKKVVISYDMPLYPFDAHSCISRFNAKKDCSVDEKQLLDREPYLTLFNEFFKNSLNVCVVSASSALIANGKASFFDKNNVLLIRDHHHLSYNGSDIVAKEYATQGCLQN